MFDNFLDIREGVIMFLFARMEFLGMEGIILSQMLIFASTQESF